VPEIDKNCLQFNSLETTLTIYLEIAKSLGYDTNIDYYNPGDPRAVKGGTFRTYTGTYPATFRTEGKAVSRENQTIGGHVYQRLLSLDSKTFDYTPSIATHWKIEDDNQTFWFRIDPNARWSDGKPVIAKDVIATWKLMTDKGILAPYTNQVYNDFEQPEIISKYIVKVKSKVLNWRQFLTFGVFMNIFPAHHLNKIDGKGYLDKYQFKMLPGTGPYVLDETKTSKGKVFTLRRRSDFWAEDYKSNIGGNNFDEIIFNVIADETLRKEKFKKGDLDYYMVGRAQWWVNEFNLETPGPGLENVLDRGLIQKRKVFNYSVKGFGGIVFNMRKAPFDDINIRKAFTMLWNRDQLIEKLFFNEYVKRHSHFPGSIYANPENKDVEYNPELANKLLDDGGWKNKNESGIRLNDKGELFELELLIVQQLERYLTPLQEDLKKAGIKLDLKIADFNTMMDVTAERRFKIAYQSWGAATIPNPRNMLHSSIADVNNTNNLTGFKNDEVDTLIDSLKLMFDSKGRIRINRKIDNIAFESNHYAMSWGSEHTDRIAYWNKFGMPKSVYSYLGDYSGVTTLWWNDAEKAKKLEEAKKDPSIKLPIGKTIVDFWNIRSK